MATAAADVTVGQVQPATGKLSLVPLIARVVGSMIVTLCVGSDQSTPTKASPDEAEWRSAGRRNPAIWGISGQEFNMKDLEVSSRYGALPWLRLWR